MRFFRGFVRLCAGTGIVLLIGGYLGALHPAGDSLAVFRLWFAAGVVIAGLILVLMRDRWVGAYFAVLAAVMGFQPASALLWPATPDPGFERDGQPYSFYQKNLLFLARDPDAILSEIETLAPDFIALQEVNAVNRAAIYDRLPSEYDRAFCPFAGVGGVAVASRFQILDASVFCIEGLGMVAAQVDTPDGVVWLTSVHLHWPYPFGQAAQVDQILPLIRRMDGPVLMGGDFNAVRWSNVMHRFEQASGSRLVPQGQTTFNLTWRNRRGPGFEIDHILLPFTGQTDVERLDYLGSDHHGLIAWFSL